jgi:hypothetical protein
MIASSGVRPFRSTIRSVQTNSKPAVERFCHE